MLKFLSCLTVDHDWRLVLVAAVVCATATFTAMRLYGVARRSTGSLRLAWSAFTGLAAGCGIWATHFVAMLAYVPHLKTGYEPGGTVLSLVLAVAVTGAGFALAARSNRLEGLSLGGVFLGGGIAVMHYTGMAAFRTQGDLHWSVTYVVVSVLISVLMAIAALAVAGPATRLRDHALGATLFTLAIVGMHFTGMSAVTIIPDPAVAVPNQVLDRAIMAVAVGGLSILIVAAAFGAMIIEAWSRKNSLDRLRDAIDAIPQAVAIYDDQDRCVMWNERYVALNAECAGLLKPGVRFAELLQAGLDAGHYPDAVGRERDWLAERLWARMQGRTVEQANDGDRWLRIEDRRMLDGGIISVCTDLTDLKRDAITLERALDEAESANRAKGAFLANMSHEIRTPLNGVVGVCDVLARTGLDTRQSDMVQMIQSSAVSLQVLLSDILDLARIDSGRVELRCESFRLDQVVRELTVLHAPQGRAKGVAVKAEVPRDAVWVRGDELRLRQVVGNFLSNALKFTEAGQVTASLSRLDDGRWRLAVADTGIGFDPALKQGLFDRFHQADGSHTRQYGGAGLGLAICRQLAELMGGEIDCDSAPGKGSTFVLTLALPSVRSPHEAAAEAEVSTPAPETSAQEASAEEALALETSAQDSPSLRVLLADDHPTNRKVVELILDQAGVELVSVENGAQAVEAFRQGRFDAVLMDMQMPVMDGLAATRAIRDFERDGSGGHTPVIMLTANALPEHVEAGRAAGADRHLSKPIGAPALIAALIEMTEDADQAHAA